MFSDKTFNKLKKTTGQWCISLYLPVAKNDIQSNRIRLRKLMFEAEKKILELGMSVDKVAKMLLPIEEILDNNSFWKEKKNCLAIYLSAETFNFYFIKPSYQETAIVSNRFYLKPLFKNRKYEILAAVKNLIQNRIVPNRLIEERN